MSTTVINLNRHGQSLYGMMWYIFGTQGRSMDKMRKMITEWYRWHMKRVEHKIMERRTS
jgi:hypothetical protein